MELELELELFIGSAHVWGWSLSVSVFGCGCGFGFVFVFVLPEGRVRRMRVDIELVECRWQNDLVFQLGRSLADFHLIELDLKVPGKQLTLAKTNSSLSRASCENSINLL